jgi:hypothetical protein
MTGKPGHLHDRLTARGLGLRPEDGAVSVSSPSFFQQDTNWYNQQAAWTAQLSTNNAASQAIATAMSNESSGMASIFNQEALTRVTNQLQAAATSATQSGSSSSTGGATNIPTSTSSGILRSYAPSLASAGTAASMLSSVLSSNASTGGLVNILT